MPEGGKRSPAELDNLAREAAKLLYEKGLSPGQVCKRLGLRDTRDVRMLIKRARDRRLVVVRVEPVDAIPTVDRPLGDELASVTGIATTLVVKTTFPLGSDQEQSTDSQAAQFVKDDDLHSQIAKRAAWHLWRCLRDRDVIGVGSGRGVGFTIQALKNICSTQNRRISDVEIFSLCGGRLFRPMWRMERSPDADHSAMELGTLLQVTNNCINLVQLPLVLDQAREIMARVAPYLLEDTPEPPSLDIAIFGLGVLSKQDHYLLSHPTTQPIQQELAHLKEHVLPLCPSAVVDVCSRFWVWSGALPLELERKAKEIVETLNGKMVAIAPTKLNRAREKILVAGGSQKYEGLLAFLREGEDQIGVRVTTLVTDEETARKLVHDLGP
jgi:DNA-binding transcriptional regulator LsrR (DeoR family)